MFIAIITTIAAAQASHSSSPSESIAWGPFILGGGGVAAALAVLRLSMMVGKALQMLDDHDHRIERIERGNDKASTNSGMYPRGRFRSVQADDDYRGEHEYD